MNDLKNKFLERLNPVHIRFYQYYKNHLKLIILSIIFSMVVSASGAALPWFLKQVVDRLFIQKEFSQLLPIMICMTGLILILNLFLFFQSYFMEKVKLNLSIHLRMKLLESIFRKKMSFIKSKHTGEMTALQNNELVLAENIPEMIARIFFEFPIRIAALFVTMLYLNFKLTLFVLVAAPLSYMIMKKARKIRKNLSGQKMKIIARIFSDFQEFLSGIKIIKAWNLFPYCRRKFDEDYRNYLVQRMREIKYNSSVKSALDLIIVLVLNLILYFAVMEIKTESATPGDYVGFIMALWLFLQPIQRIGMGYSNLVNATVAAERVLDVFEGHHYDEDNLEKGTEIEFINKIEIVDATYSYDGNTILEGINMSFEPSKVYVIIGPNGIGKSTIIESLIGFVQPSSGKILFNSVPLEQYNLSNVRSRISIVTQDIFLFNHSVRENIIFNNGFDDLESRKRYEWALKTARVFDFLDMRGRNDSSELSEHGSNFSGGEKQRLCIARALFKEYDLIILDESNSNISKDVFSGILDTLCRNKDGKIIIFISQDSTYWHFGDIIYEVSDKNVTRVEHGNW
ncbi:MAG: ABC transporter ATP-binding protein [Deltaproteobacteria bacterium]|nr:ABC transporter ATP-binding protein [Deltaproteobacteria bacterium]